MDKRFDFASCFTLQNVMQAAIDCYKGVGWKRQPQAFMNKCLTNCVQLLKEVEDGTYRPSSVKSFTINERGKVREVKPVAYRDRVIQRCFCDNVLVPAVEGFVSEECSAVLPNRGLDYAFSRVKKQAERCDEGGWVVQFDFSGYFASIDQTILLAMLRGMIGDERLYGFCETVIKEDAPGLELGSHVSQLCAAAFPTLLDQAVSDLDGVTGYHRYMDDGIVFCRDKESAKRAISTVMEWSGLLKLTVNPKKTRINRITHPFVFCKMRFTYVSVGNVRMNVRKQQSRRAVKHAKSVARKAWRNGGIDLVPVRAALQGYVEKGDADLSRLVDAVFGD